MSFDNYQE